MWLFTRYGFYSVVCARQGHGALGGHIDAHLVMVRSRRREHLQRLIQRFPASLGSCEIFSFSDADYAFRIFVRKRDWSKVLVDLNEEMDYDNFKSEVTRFLGRDGLRYEQSLHDVWSVMHGLQE